MSEGGPVDENLCEGDPAWDEPKCPVCGSRRITRSGVQKFGVTERWRGDELTDWDLGEADEWVETRGMACNACGHTAESAEEWLHGSTGPPEYWFCAQCNWVGLDSEADQQGDDAEPAERLCPRCDDARALWAVRQDGVVARIRMWRPVGSFDLAEGLIAAVLRAHPGAEAFDETTGNVHYRCPGCGRAASVANARAPDGSRLCTCLSCEKRFTVRPDGSAV
jgi:hypothetical protein